MPEGVVRLQNLVAQHLPDGVVEEVLPDSIEYVVPHSIYPNGYHCDPKKPLPFASITWGKTRMSLHLFCLYVDSEASALFRERYLATGKRLDMGAGCVRFKKIEDLPLEVVAETLSQMTVAGFIERYESTISRNSRGKR